MNRTVAVIGCGWLGLPLAISLVNEKYRVHGSSTSKEKLSSLETHHIKPFLLTLFEDKIKGNIAALLSNVEAVIINIPPKLRSVNAENYVKKMQLLHQELGKSEVRKIIFISSTSVYGDIEGAVDEEMKPQPSTESGRQLLAAEKIFQNDSSFQTTVLRFGGLIGPDRHPVTMLTGRQNLTNGNQVINLIHLSDCIRIISSILEFNWWNELFNGVYPNHPRKEEYYTNVAKNRNLPLPTYKSDTSKKGKIVSSNRLLIAKKFEFIKSP